MLRNIAAANDALTRLQREGWSTDADEARRQFDEHLREIGFRRPETKKRKRVFKVLPPATCWEEEFARTIPGRPLCAPDSFDLGVYPCKREIALAYPYVQFNRSTLFRWLVVDIDRTGAADAWRTARLPPPNMAMTNPANGHAHLAWLLAVPVSGDPSAKSFRFLAAIESAYRRRLNADAAFCMYGQVKNPLHADWHTLRIFNTLRFANAAYSLRELAAPLEPSEMKPATKRKPKRKRETGLSRNVTVFDELREFAYGVVLDFKAFDDRDAYLDQLFDHAEKLNGFRTPLPASALRSIVKSVAKWTWRKFSEKQFEKLQSWRANHRWKDHVTAAERADAAGVSRATLYRQEKKLRERNSQVHVETMPYQEG
jgi:hypothetical protein